MYDTFWPAVTALATVAGVAAILYAGRQIHFWAWLEAQKIWVDKEFLDNRRNIFSRLDNPEQPWTPEEKAAGLDACRKLDEFSYLVPFLGRRRMLKVWGDPLAKAWLILEPLVSEERDRTGFRDKWDGFRRLGTKALSIHSYLLETPRTTDGEGAEPSLTEPPAADAGNDDFGDAE